jgi:hypothetical protein
MKQAFSVATTITINRAPVLTLWATVVAERLGFDRDEALTLDYTAVSTNSLHTTSSIAFTSFSICAATNARSL